MYDDLINFKTYRLIRQLDCDLVVVVYNIAKKFKS